MFKSYSRRKSPYDGVILPHKKGFRTSLNLEGNTRRPKWYARTTYLWYMQGVLAARMCHRENRVRLNHFFMD